MAILHQQHRFVQKIALISFSHHNVAVQDVGRFHIDESRRASVLNELKSRCGIAELMYLSTCNRVEFLLVAEHEASDRFVSSFLTELFAVLGLDNGTVSADNALIFTGESALRHMFRVAASLDSLVVGEREIITQVRKAYDDSVENGLSGDTIRIMVKKTIHVAKEVYTATDIARNPVSVVSLANRRLRELNVPLDARFIVIGAGVTNTAMLRYLHKHGYRNFSVFNRSLPNAEKLAEEIGARAFTLAELDNYKEGFDVIVTCTASEQAVITEPLYRSLAGNDRSRKVVIDLAVPNDLDEAILNNWEINLIAVNNLQDVAKQNLKERERSIEDCHAIIDRNLAEFRHNFRQRQVELAMQVVPQKVKEIRETALNSVFAKEIDQMDPQAKEVLDKVIAYMEKKYISVPMKMAREILTEENTK